MTSLLLAFGVVMLVPLFVADWRASLLGLVLQGLLLAWIAWRLHGLDPSLSTALRYVDLVGLRAIVGPALLWRVLAARDTPGRNDLLPPNMLAWVAALGLVLLGFRLAPALVPMAGEARDLVGLAAGAALLGFLVLATQVGPLSQIVGALRIENAIALLELSGPEHGELGVQAGQLVVFAGTLAMFRWYLANLAPAAPADGGAR